MILTIISPSIHMADRQDLFNYRPMVPSYPAQPSAFPPQRLPPSLPSTHTPAPHHQSPLKRSAQSPTFSFHHPQPSPQLPSLFPISDTNTPSTSAHPIGLNGFSPSVLGFPPTPLLSESSFNVASTPPSNPPFDMSDTSDTTPRTPEARPQASRTHTDSGLEKDPFMGLLEQLAENETSQGAPSELDFFLGESVKEEAMAGGIKEDGEENGNEQGSAVAMD